MARTNILGRSGVGKSWFGGYVLQEILAPDGERVMACACDEGDCSHTPADDEWVSGVEPGDDDGDVPEFDNGQFERAIHVDIEDEERGFSDVDDPVLLTFNVDSELLGQYVNYNSRDAMPYFIPEREEDTGTEVLLAKWVFYKHRYIRVVPEGLTDEETILLVEMLADAAMKAGDTHFSLDEAHLVAKKHNIGDKLMRLATGGRKRGVEWLFITQRPQKLHEDLLSQSDYTIYFELRDKDRDKAAEKSEAIEDAEETIESLGKRTAIIEDFDRGEYHQFSTEDLDRQIEHVSGDDGKANAAYEGLFDTPGDSGQSDDSNSDS